MPEPLRTKALMDLFLARDSDLHKKIFGPFNRKQFQAKRKSPGSCDVRFFVQGLKFGIDSLPRELMQPGSVGTRFWDCTNS